jgi:hypothetical protein
VQERESEEEFEILWRKNPKVNTLFSDGRQKLSSSAAVRFDFTRILDDFDLAHASRAQPLLSRGISFRGAAEGSLFLFFPYSL